MTLARLPLAFPIQSRAASTAKDARLVNAMKESKQDKTEVIKRPGLSALPITPAMSTGQGQGIYSWNNYLVAGVNNNLYLITGQTGSTLLGTVTGNQLPFSFTTVANDVKLAFHNGSNLYTVNQGTPPTFTGGVGLSGVVSSVVINNGGGYYGYATACTIAVGATTVVTQTAHGLVAGQGVTFTGTLPTGMAIGTTYQVVYIDANSYSINTISTGGGIGVAVATSGSSSGVSCLASPTVTFSASPGTTATGTAQLFNHQVAGVVVTGIGAGYLSTPTITFSAPPALYSTATATIINSRYTIGGNFNYIIPGNFTIAGLISANIGTAGAGYLTAPTITFSQSIDAGYPIATGFTTVNSAGQVTAINITYSGEYQITGPTNNFTTETVTATIAAPIITTASATTVMSAAITGPFAAGIAYLDGTCYVMGADAKVYNSAINDPTTWSGSYLQASSDPDGGVGLTRHLNYLVAFGQWSTEFFYDAGNATGSPLAVNQSAKLEIGCANGYSIANAEQTVIWVGQSLSEGRCVYLLDGLSPVKISNRYIDKYLNAATMQPLASGASSVRAYIFKKNGHTLYVLTMVDLNLTLVYDLDEKEWYQWTSQSGDTGVTNSGTETYFKGTAYEGEVEYSGSSIYLQDDQNGLIYKLDSTYYNDNNNHIYFRAISPNLDSGTNKRKFYQRLEVIGDKVAGSAYLRFSKDDYVTWSAYRAVTLNLDRPVLYQNGQSRRRAQELFISDDIPVRLEAIEYEFEVGETGQ